MRFSGPAKIVETAGWGHFDDELARVDGDWRQASRAIRADFR